MDVFRIVAHTDFDGLVSALLLQELLGVEEVVFAEPWEINDGTFKVQRTDALADLPYAPCALWFDHHASSARPLGPGMHFDAKAKSCPRVIFNLHKERLHKFHHLVVAADKIDSADFSQEDISNPTPAMQIALSLDTDEYRRFLLDQLREHSIEHVASLRIVQERYRRKLVEQEEFLAGVEERTFVRGKTLVVEAQGLAVPHPSLIHFILYLRHPQTSVSILIFGDGPRLWLRVGENNFTRLNAVDIGAVMREYGGGGHKVAGGCTIPAAQQEEIINRLVNLFNQ